MKDQDINNYVDLLCPSMAGKIIFHCLPFRKKVILKNMRHVFKGSLSEEQVLKLAKSFYSHIATSIKENMLMRFMSEKKIKSKGMVKGIEHVLNSSKQGNQGVLILTGHFGNWEFAPIAGILNFKQYQGRLYFIRKTLGLKFLEKLLFRRYYLSGLNVITKKNALTKACDELEKNNAVVFVMDQHACIQAKDGIAVDFFGKKAGTYRSLATIADYTRLNVVPAVSYRLPDGRHVLEFFKALEHYDVPDRRESLRQNTRLYNQTLENLIMARPEQWLWMHNRWKLEG